MNSTPHALAAFRIAVAVLVFVCHGWHKIFEAFGYFVGDKEWKLVVEISELGLPLPSLSALFATFAQTLGAILVGLGWWTRIASLIVVASLLGAILQNISTGRDPQLAILYTLSMMLIAGTGGGSWKLENRKS